MKFATFTSNISKTNVATEVCDVVLKRTSGLYVTLKYVSFNDEYREQNAASRRI